MLCLKKLYLRTLRDAMLHIVPQDEVYQLVPISGLHPEEAQRAVSKDRQK